LRAGHTMPSAMELLGEEMGDPVGTEMKIAYEEQRFGISVPESLLHMVQRVDSMDLRYFVAAVLIQQETGGNLAALMENIAHVVRSRLNFKAKVRGLSASGRISAWIMVAVPIVAFFGMMVIAPQYEKILIQSALGQKLLMGGVVLIIIGAYVLKRMVQSLET
jgi:tight adherence protein B